MSTTYGYLDHLIEEATESLTEKNGIVLEICRHEAGMLPKHQMTDKARTIYTQWEQEMKEEVTVDGSSKERY